MKKKQPDLTKLLLEAVEIMKESIDLWQDAARGDYEPDSFTAQPLEVFVKKITKMELE